jgi:AcrR family transcriptional regulator
MQSEPRYFERTIHSPRVDRDVSATTLTPPLPRRPPKQDRAVNTRKMLIMAARSIFAREGFEHSSIEDIASHAGKTRGAFYDNFRNKEDIFLAIFEEDIRSERTSIRVALRTAPSLIARLDLIAACLTDLISNRERTLLYLEFKTHVVRSLTHHKRLADLHAAVRLGSSLPELDKVFPELRLRPELAKRECSLAISGVVDGLAINHLFDPGILSVTLARQIIRSSLNLAIVGGSDVAVMEDHVQSNGQTL